MAAIAILSGGAVATAASPSPVASQGTAGVDLVLAIDAPIDVIGLDGSVWVSQIHGDAVLRLDPVSGAVTATVPTGAGSGPGSFATDGTFLYVPNQRGTGVSKIDPVTNSVVGVAEQGTSDLGATPALAAGSLWVSSENGTGYRIDPTTLTTITKVQAGGGYVAVDDAIWGTSDTGLTVTDPGTNAVTQTAACCGWPTFALDGDLWAFPGDHTAVVVDAATQSVRATYDLGMDVSTGTADAGYVWLLAPSTLIDHSKVLKVDPATGAVIGSVSLPGLPPTSLRVIGDHIWVTSFDSGKVIRLPVF
jgi:DNA-binding beta-propeller fold protein YncE